MIFMQIQSDNNLAARLVQDGKTVQTGGKLPLKPDNKTAAVIENGFETILNKALNPIDDRSVIEQARLDLKEGRLESDLAFEQAADNLFRYGL